MKQFFQGVKQKVLIMMTAAMMLVMTSVSAFAAEGEAAVTADMLTPIIDGLKANVAVIIPVGIGIFAIMIGLKLIPRLFKMFTKG